MAEDWEFKGLHARVERLEKRLDEEDQRRWDRSLFWLKTTMWTLAVVYITVIVVLAITHSLHNH